PRCGGPRWRGARGSSGGGSAFSGFSAPGCPGGAPNPPRPRAGSRSPPLPRGFSAPPPGAGPAEPLVRAIREFRPHVMLTYDEKGGYPHPDHVMTHEVSVAAWEAAADPDAYPDSGEPWQPLKMYYFVSFHGAKFVALHEEMLRRGLES